DRKRRQRTEGQPDRRVEQPSPLTEQVAPEDARQLPRNRRDDDLQSLEADEDHRREDTPLAERVLQELLVNVEPGQELIRGRVGRDEPDDAAHEGGGDDAADPPAPRRLQPPPRDITSRIDVETCGTLPAPTRGVNRFSRCHPRAWTLGAKAHFEADVGETGRPLEGPDRDDRAEVVLQIEGGVLAVAPLEPAPR